jgi:hypothetical protein
VAHLGVFIDEVRDLQDGCCLQCAASSGERSIAGSEELRSTRFPAGSVDRYR